MNGYMLGTPSYHTVMVTKGYTNKNLHSLRHGPSSVRSPPLPSTPTAPPLESPFASPAKCAIYAKFGEGVHPCRSTERPSCGRSDIECRILNTYINIEIAKYFRHRHAACIIFCVAACITCIYSAKCHVWSGVYSFRSIRQFEPLLDPISDIAYRSSKIEIVKTFISSCRFHHVPSVRYEVWRGIAPLLVK